MGFLDTLPPDQKAGHQQKPPQGCSPLGAAEAEEGVRLRLLSSLFSWEYSPLPAAMPLFRRLPLRVVLFPGSHVSGYPVPPQSCVLPGLRSCGFPELLSPSTVSHANRKANIGNQTRSSRRPAVDFKCCSCASPQPQPIHQLKDIPVLLITKRY